MGCALAKYFLLVLYNIIQCTLLHLLCLLSMQVGIKYFYKAKTYIHMFSTSLGYFFDILLMVSIVVVNYSLSFGFVLVSIIFFLQYI